MTGTVTRTIKPRYVNQGNTHSYRTGGYKRTSSLGGAFEKPALARFIEAARSIVRIGLVPGLWLGVLFLVATLGIVAVSGRLPSAPRHSAEPETACRLGPSGEYRLAQGENK